MVLKIRYCRTYHQLTRIYATSEKLFFVFHGYHKNHLKGGGGGALASVELGGGLRAVQVIAVLRNRNRRNRNFLP